MQISVPEVSLLKFHSTVEETQTALPCFKGAKKTTDMMLHKTAVLVMEPDSVQEQTDMTVWPICWDVYIKGHVI